MGAYGDDVSAASHRPSAMRSIYGRHDAPSSRVLDDTDRGTPRPRQSPRRIAGVSSGTSFSRLDALRGATHDSRRVTSTSGHGSDSGRDRAPVPSTGSPYRRSTDSPYRPRV